ncbi:MAG: CotH kinase family protein [Muribaculaceae bacterium]|nr:CotH kinase family protein [Muribaculaceae bacterium]
MKKYFSGAQQPLLILFFAFLSLFPFSISVNAQDIFDNENRPIIYLRGQATGWDIDSKYQFSRSGDTYTLVINENNAIPEGEFKIATCEWNTIDFGGSEGDIYIDSSQYITLVRTGKNLHTSGISSGVISFTLKDTYVQELEVLFDLGGNIPKPADKTSGTLPVMHINVYTDENHKAYNNEINDYNLSHKNYFEYSEYWIDVNGCEWMEDLGAENVGSEEKPLPLQIKARGNWTRIGFSKKPFKIKLDKKQNLLGLTPSKSKHYALLAHADDNYGYLRNYTSFNLGERIGLPWTPAMQPVELIINGDYRGLYFLTESIRVGDGRIEIEELNDFEEEPELISGGYIVELDNYDEENQIRMEEKSFVGGHYLDALRITWDTPEEYSEIQKLFVKDQFSAMNNAIGRNDDIIWRYLDLDDAARYYLVQEIVSDTESYHGSTYLYRDRGEGQKWHFSPLWDAGNAFNGYTNTFFYTCDPFGNTWIPSMRENTAFNEKVKDTWLWFMQKEYPGIESDLDDYASHLLQAVQYDYKRWANEPAPGGGQRVADNRNMAEKLNIVKDKLRAKTQWMKGIFGDYAQGNYTEPTRDNTLAMELPDYAHSVIDSDLIITDKDAPMEIYNLQGVRIEHPRKGEIYILRQGTKSHKVIW